MFYPMQKLNELRSTALEHLKWEILRSHYRKSGPSCEVMPPDFGTEPQKPEIRASVETFEQFQVLIRNPLISGIYLDCCMFLEPYTEDPRISFRHAMQMLHETGNTQKTASFFFLQHISDSICHIDSADFTLGLFSFPLP